MTGFDYCEWAILCEVAAGLVEVAPDVVRRREIVRHVAHGAMGAVGGDGRRLREWTGWRRKLLEWTGWRLSLGGILSRTADQCLDAIDLSTAEISFSEIEEQDHLGQLIAEMMLFSPRLHPDLALRVLYNANRDRVAELGALAGVESKASTEEQLRALTAILASLPLLAQATKLSIARHAVRRLLTWPLCHVPGVSLSGLSIPICVDVGSAEHALITCRVLGCDHVWALGVQVPSSAPRICESFHTATVAGLDAWRAKHGRVRLDVRDNVFRRSSILLDLQYASRAFAALRRAPELVRFTSASQRSLEASLAVAVVSRLIKVRPAKTAITGTLGRVENSPWSWRTEWQMSTQSSQQLLTEMIRSKSLHAGRTGAYERMVVPADDQGVYEMLRSAPELEGAPHIISVGNLDRAVDLGLSGQWRPERFVRCERLRDADRVGASRYDIAAVRGVLQRADTKGIYLHAPGREPESVATAVASHLLALNRRYREFGQRGAPARTTASKTTPPAVAYLLYHMAPNEDGGSFVATLLHAITGGLSREMLVRAHDVYRRPAVKVVRRICDELESWFNHSYTESEPWQAPEISVFFGVEACREADREFASIGGNPWSALEILSDLAPKLSLEPCDSRHFDDLGVARLVVIDASDAPMTMGREWKVVTLPSAPPPRREVRSSAVGGALRYLSLFRGATAPTPVVMSMLAALQPEVIPAERPHHSLFQELNDENDATAEGRRVGGGTYLLRDALWSLPASAYRTSANAVRAEFEDLDAATRHRVELRVHATIACAYAPWLPMADILSSPAMSSPAAGPDLLTSERLWSVPADEWLLPSRLVEVAHHLREASYLARRQPNNSTRDRDLCGRLEDVLSRLGRVDYSDVGSRIYWFFRVAHKMSAGTSYWAEFQAQSGARTGKLEIPFTILWSALSGLSEVVRQPKKLPGDLAALRSVANEMVKSATEELLAPVRAPAVWSTQRLLAYLALGLVHCNDVGTFPGDIWAVVEREPAFAVHELKLPNAGLLGRMLEALGDAAYGSGDRVQAARIYEASCRLAPTYWRCAIKYDVVRARRSPGASRHVPDSEWESTNLGLADRFAVVFRLGPALRGLEADWRRLTR